MVPQSSEVFVRNMRPRRPLNLYGWRDKYTGDCTMRTTRFLGSLALISAVAIGPAVAAGGKSHAILVPGAASKTTKPPTPSVPTASPGFQPQQDPLGPAPTATALRPSATAGSPD